MTIHSNSKDFWRYYEDRLLINQMLKTPDAKLEYFPTLGRWKVNGKRVKMKGKIWGKFHELIVRIFREIWFLFKSQYKRRFYIAKDAVYRAYEEGRSKEIEVERHIDKKRKSIPFLGSQAQKTKARMKVVLRSAEKYTVDRNSAQRLKIEAIKGEIEELKGCISELKQFLLDKSSPLATFFRTHQSFCKINLNKLKNYEIERIIRKLVNERRSLESEKEALEKRAAVLSTQLDKMKANYAGEELLIRRTIEVIEGSPLKNSFVQREQKITKPLVVRRLNY